MKKKRIGIDKIVIILLVIVAIMLGCTLVATYQDISQVRTKLMEQSLKENIYIHGKLINQLFSSRLNEVEGMAAGIIESYHART